MENNEEQTITNDDLCKEFNINFEELMGHIKRFAADSDVYVKEHGKMDIVKNVKESVTRLKNIEFDTEDIGLSQYEYKLFLFGLYIGKVIREMEYQVEAMEMAKKLFTEESKTDSDSAIDEFLKKYNRGKDDTGKS